MMSSVLSQEEINALLNDTFAKEDDHGDAAADASSTTGIIQDLNTMEKDTLGELANISMGAAATTLSALLGKRVEITTPKIQVTTIEDIKAQYTNAYVIVDVNYTKGLKGKNVLILHTFDAGVIVDLMMGGDGSQPPIELNDLHLSAVSESMNQMMGASCTSLSQILGKRIDIQPPLLDLYELQDRDILGNDQDIVVKVAFRVVIQDLIDSEMMQILPVSFARTLVEEMLAKNDLTKYQPAEKTQSKEFTRPDDMQKEKSYTIVTETAPPLYSDVPHSPGLHAVQQAPVAVSPVNFGQLTTENVVTSQPNLDLILDVGLQLSVELGRTHKKIKEILELSVGSVLELDKLAGEPVDILINGRLLAKGEVVVIDENFGVRVTEIISRLDRVKNLK